MVISQLMPFTKEKGISRRGGEHRAARRRGGERRGPDALGLDVGHARPPERAAADDRPLGRGDALALRLGGNVAGLFVMVFVVYWCFGTQLSVNASTTADFWGTKNAGINYGMLYTAYGVAGVIGPRIGSAFFDKYHNYEAAFFTAAGLAAVALVCELLARRPTVPSGVTDQVE